MPSYTLPLDANSRPASGGYTPAIGVITLQTGTPTTDGLNVTSAPLNVVLVPDSGTYQEQSSLSAGYQGAYLVPMTDVSAFKWLSLHITGGYNGTLAFQISNDGQNWDPYPMAQQNTPGLLVSSVTNQTGVFGGPVIARYFQVQMVNYGSGIATGILEQYVVPPMLPVPISPTGIKVDGSGVTQPVVGVFTIDTRNQAPIPISQTQVGLVGASVPLSAALLGASDGVSLRALSVDGSGNLNVNVAPGSAGNTNTGALLNAIAITSGLQSADQTNATGQGAKIALSMTSVGTGSVTLVVEGKDTASGQYYPILQGLPVTTNGVSVYTVYPGVPVGQNVAIANELVLPTTWRVRTLANNSNPTSYTVGASVFGSLTSGGGGGSSSSFSATFPSVGTAIGASDGTNMKALLVDGSGYLKVNVVAGGASGGTALADDATFTAGTTSLTPSGGVYNDAIASATSGHADAVRITAKRAFHTNLRDSSGNELLGSKTSANSVPVVIASDQGAVTISGTVTANMGTTNGLALDTSVNGLLLSQGSTTSSQKGPLILGAVTTNAPSYTTAQSSPLSLDPSGLLRVSLKDTPSNTNNLNVNLAASSVTQSVSGTVTANAGTGPFPVAGIVASGASNANNPVKVGGVFNTTQPTVTTGQIVDAQMTARGASIVATGVDAFAVNASQVGTWNVTNVSGTVSLPTGAATSAKQPVLGTAGSASSDVLTVQGIASMTALKVDGSAVTQPISGTVSITANSSVNIAQLAGITTDTNSGNKSAGTLRVVLATDQPQLTNALKVDGSGVTQPVSGTITANGGTGPFSVAGMVASGASNANNPVKGGGVFNTTQPTVTTGQIVDAQYTARGASIVATGTDTFNVTVNAALPTGSNTIGAVTQASGPWSQNITQVGASSLALGQTTMTASLPVTMASNQGNINVVVNAALPIGSNTIGAVTQASGPWTSNVTQFGGNTVVTGTGASGVGIPRMTVSNDSTVNTQHASVVSTANSSTAALAAHGTFTGTGESTLNYSALSLAIFTDQSGTLSVQQSQDNANWDIQDTFSVTATTVLQTTINLVGQYYHVVYTNGGMAQTTFRLQTIKQTSEAPLPRTLTSLGNLKVAVQEAPTTTSSSSFLHNVGGSTTSVSILAPNTARKGVSLYNDSSSAMYLAFATAASTSAYTVKIPASTLYEMPAPPVYLGTLSAVWDTATGSARVTELT